MKKVRKKSLKLCFALSLILCLTSSTIALASTTNVNVSTTPPITENIGEITPNDYTPPNTVINLVDYGQYDFSGNTYGGIYTLKAFTGMTSCIISVSNYHSEPLTMKLYKEVFLGQTLVEEWTISKKATFAVRVSDLKSTGNYYLYFSGPNDFKGHIRAVE